MSDGIKAMYEDMEEEAHRERLVKLKKLSPNRLLYLIDKAKTEADYLRDSGAWPLPRDAHAAIEDLREAVEALP